VGGITENSSLRKKRESAREDDSTPNKRDVFGQTPLEETTPVKPERGTYASKRKNSFVVKWSVPSLEKK